MNSIIKSIKLSDCLFFDIETVRQKEVLRKDDPLWDILRWQYRNKDTDELATDEEVEFNYRKNGGLLPELGKIACITMGQFKDDVFYIKSYYGDEPTIIKEFVKKVNSQKFILIGFNTKFFDLPFIRKRAAILGVPYIDKIKGNDSGIKPWDLDGTIIDLMEHWRGSNFINSSLELVCYALDIPTPKGAIRGNEVSDTYFNGGLNTIVKYCEGDVIATANIVRRWRDEGLINDDVKVLTEEIAAPKGLVERIRDEGLTPELYTELVGKQKSLSKDEKEKAVKIIEAALVLRKEKLTAKQLKELKA